MNPTRTCRDRVNSILLLANKRWLVIFLCCAFVVFLELDSIKLHIACWLADSDCVLVSVVRQNRKAGDSLYETFQLSGSDKNAILAEVSKNTSSFSLMVHAEIPVLSINLITANGECVGQIGVYGAHGETTRGDQMWNIAKNGVPITTQVPSSMREYVIRRRLMK